MVEAGQKAGHPGKAARKLAGQDAAYPLSDIGPREVRAARDVIVEPQTAHAGRARRVHPLERLLNRGGLSRAQFDAGMAVCNRAAAVELAGGVKNVHLGEVVDGGGSAGDLKAVQTVQAVRRYLEAIAPLSAEKGTAGMTHLSERDLVRKVCVEGLCIVNVAGPARRAQRRVLDRLRASLETVSEHIVNIG